ncbi:hypothetical protein B0H19DRAFT_892038, partial [Mycena capillaripes]
VKREVLKEEIEAHKALISPMRHLPQDLLQEIFTSCLPTKHNALVDPQSAPLLLGFICRHWRKIAHSTPRLWASLHIPISTQTDRLSGFVSAFEGIVDSWLGRSGACPLSI